MLVRLFRLAFFALLMVITHADVSSPTSPRNKGWGKLPKGLMHSALYAQFCKALFPQCYIFLISGKIVIKKPDAAPVAV